MNNKIILVVAALFMWINATAQIEKGRILASGSLGFNFSNYREVDDGITGSESNSSDFWLTPRAGIFLTDAILVGAGIGLSAGVTKYDDDDKYSYSSVSFTPFVRYYLPQRLFGQIEIGPGIEMDKWDYANGGADDKDQFGFILWSVGVGYAQFLNENVSIEPIISYTSTSYTNKDNTNQKDKYGDLGFQLGFSIYLGRP